ncbi:beta strand repeat-containing protein [Sphingopyxis solisilvae]|uniref:beta strand repeat-containing protein n=1 Tax=Sphingopyxis solisilvae TaxID=1886788 RepID=UPI001892BED0|nr:hypothetical protein [Sphingopyxis solisilvae]
MRTTASTSPARTGRQRLLTSCAIAAGLAALAMGGPALAQVAGSGSIVSGTGAISPPGPGATTVTTTTPQAIINWTPTDTAPTSGAIDFLPTGNTLNFVGTGSYTVLNRFVDGSGGSIARQIALNGTVNSYVGSTTGPRGGNIWFYNAGGILIGATGAINVGSLVLTANDINTTGGLFGPGGTIRFNGAAGSQSAITVNGTINANVVGNPGGSYVALVAPRIVQAGTIRVDGSAAFVAAEQADIRINNGLFDINVLVGAEGGTVITHSGTTTGPAHEQGDIDQSRIYMVAIPKNDAVTMLVSGQVGYDDAVSAQTDPDGAVVLSAGYNIVNGQIAGSPVGNGTANITVNDTIFRSDTTARASGAFVGGPLATIPPPGGTFAPPPHLGRLIVQGNGTFIGDQSATLVVQAGQVVGATGDIVVRSAAGGAAAVNVVGGTFAVLGDLVIEAAGVANSTGDSEGGDARLTISGGNALVGGSVTIAADATGSDFLTEGSTGGTGRGGSASLVMTGGTFTAGDITVSADGVGGGGLGAGGLGIGGTATIDLLGGTIDVADLIASASGTGGQGFAGNDGEPTNIIPGGVGGVGAGGQATINIDGATVQAGLVAAYASGRGGEGGAFNNIFSFSGVPGTPGDGGTGTGGSAAVNVTGGTLDTSSLIVDATGIGGQGGSSFFSSSSGSATGIGVGGTGGTGQGGSATLALATNIDAGSIQVAARGQGGAGGLHNVGGNGGDAGGGLAQMIVTGFNAGLFFINLDAGATGGNGAAGRDGNGGNGGSAVGGTARAVAGGTGGRFEARGIVFTTAGRGGNGGAGGLAPFAFVTAAPDGGDGGSGTGGVVELFASAGGVISLTPGSSGPQPLGSNGFGGNGGAGANHFGAGRRSGDGGDAGAGSGGVVRLIADGGTITTTQAVTVTVQGVSGSGGAGGTGSGGATNGAAGASAIANTGGRAVLESAGGGLISLGDTIINASGDVAGRIELRTDASPSSRIALTTLTASALGEAAPTDGDIEEALTGIFVAVDGGTITATGDVTLETGSAVGVHARNSGSFTVGGNLLIDAGERFDVRHDARSGTAPTIGAAGDFTIIAPQGIFGTQGSLLSAGGVLALSSSAGAIQVDALDSGNDIVIAAAGAVSVEHAEAVNDFIASGVSFRTGLNSIITGGDILVNAPGAVDLGNSTAGGLVQATGQSILFNTIGAGGPVFLTATGNTAGAEGISGGSIDAGGDIVLNATRIGITGTLTTNGSLFAVGSAGPVSIALAEVEDDISIFAGGDLTGTYNAEGNISLTSTANINASANATGFQSSSSGPPIASSVLINAGGDVTLNDNSATGMFGVNAGGAVTMTGGTIGEDLLVLAGTTATITGVTAGDDVIINAPGGIIATGVVTTGAGRDDRTLIFAPFSPTAPATFQIVGSAPDQSNIVLTAAAGDITASNLNAAANLTATAAGTLSATGPLRAGGNIALTATDANLATLITPSGDRLDTVNAGGNVTIAVTDVLTGGVVRAGGNVGITAGSTANLLEIVTAAGNVTVSAADGVVVDMLRSGGTTALASTDGGIVVNSLDSAGAVSAAGRTIQIAGQNNLNFASLTTTGGDADVRTSGNLSVTTASVAGLADLRAGNDLSVSQLTAGNVNLEANRDMTLNNVTTAGSLFASAVGMATINGIVTGPELFVNSGDITIASTGRIGQLGTTNSVLVANISNQNPTFIGGTGTRSGWHLDASEITRIFGGDITVRGERLESSQGSSVGSSRSPDVFVEGFTINAAQQLGPNGTFLISTPGKMRVRGDVRFNGMTDSQSVNLFGRDSVEVILGSGSVHLSGQSPDQLAGNLTIEADDIAIATTQAIADIAAMTSTAAIDARLAQNDGIISDIGALAANRITLNHNLDDSVYIQNSGTGTAFADRRGITFGQGGLFINGPGNQDSLVINAAHRGASGALVTGLDVIPLVNINAPTGSSTVVQTGFNAQSTINGCLIGNVASCTAPVRPSEDSNFPVQDVIDDPAEDEDGNGQSLPVPLITMRDLDPLSGEPLLDDPVTGAGNDDLWTPTEGP